MEKYIKKYSTPGEPLAFSARNAFARITKKNSDVVNKEILSKTFAYPLHRFYKKPEYTNPYLTIDTPREQIQCDIIDMQRLSTANNGYKYLLVFIDVFSRFLWVRPIKRKTKEDTYNVFKDMIENVWMNKPKQIASDRGKEFNNRLVKQLLQNNAIKLIHPTSYGKAVYAERVNGTLQNLIYRYLTENQTKRYIDVLQKIVDTYNGRGHRSLDNLPPREAERDQNLHFFRYVQRQNKNKIILKGRRKKPKFKIGDIVRLHHNQRVFNRGYQESFSREIYEIIAINPHLPITVYTIKSLDTNAVMEGDFYDNQLQLVNSENKDVHKIEKVLRTRGDGADKEFYVKWFGFNNRHNSWVKKQDII